MKNRLRKELEAMLELHTGDSFTADNVHTLVNGIFAADEGGGFEFVEYDNNAFPYPQTIGKTAPSITGLGPADETMIDTIFIMPNKETDPDATLMIVVDEKDPSTDPKTYQYVYVGNINDLPSDVLTEGSIVNDLSTGGTYKPLSAEQGRTLNSHVNYVTCGSGAADQVKLIPDDGFELSTHLRLLVKMTNTNTNSTPKFNINNTGIKDVWYNSAVASDTNTWSAGEVLDVYYDGTSYIATTYGGAQFATGEKVKNVSIDDEPTAGSDNLVKSGGVATEIGRLEQKIFENVLNKDVRQNRVIIENTLTWGANGESSYSYIINREEHFGSSLQVVPQNGVSTIAFLSEIGSESPVFCEDTTIIKILSKQVLEIPQECKYIYVFGSWDGSNVYYPQKINFLYNSKDIESIAIRTEEINYKITSLFQFTDLYRTGTVVNACIITTLGSWISAGRSYIIDLTQYESLQLNIVGNSSYQTIIAFLKEVPQSYSGVANFCDGESGVRLLSLGSSESFSIPQDCGCLYVFDYYSESQASYPKKINLVSTSILEFSKISTELTELNTDIESIAIDTTNGRETTKLVEQTNIPDLDLSNFIIEGNICVIGDSTISGYISNVPVASYLSCTGVKTDISQPGDTIYGQLSKWNNLPSATRSSVNYIFVQIGLNDLGVDETNEGISSRYQELVTSLRSDSPNAKIILCTMIPEKQRAVDVSPTNWNLIYEHWKTLNYQIRNRLFIGCNTSIDAHTTILNDGNDNLLSMYDTGDHIHPNAAGGKVIAWSWLCGYRN